MTTQEDIRNEVLDGHTLESIHSSKPYRQLSSWIDEHYDAFADYRRHDNHPRHALRVLALQLCHARRLAVEMLEYEKDVKHINAIMERVLPRRAGDIRPISSLVADAFTLMFARLESRGMEAKA